MGDLDFVEPPKARAVGNCATCLQTLVTRVVILDCQHKHCYDCASRLFGNKVTEWRVGDRNQVTCPVCVTKTVIRSADRAIEEPKKEEPDPDEQKEEEEEDPSVLCGQCEKRLASLECLQCSEYFCGLCGEMVHERGRMKMHTVQPFTQPNTSDNNLFEDFTGKRCRVHPDEYVAYACIQCESECVCTECVVHGSHKDHEVLTIRKAVDYYRDRLTNLLDGINEKYEEVANVKRRVADHGDDLKSNTKQIKVVMSQSFEEVRDRLRKKEEELMQSADFFLEEQLSQVDDCLKFADRELKNMTDTKNTSGEHLSNATDSQLINYYANNRAFFTKLLKPNPELQFDTTDLEDKKNFMNMQATSKQVDALQGLHLVIAALRDPAENYKPREKPKCAIIGCNNDGDFLVGDKPGSRK